MLRKGDEGGRVSERERERERTGDGRKDREACSKPPHEREKEKVQCFLFLFSDTQERHASLKTYPAREQDMARAADIANKMGRGEEGRGRERGRTRASSFFFFFRFSSFVPKAEAKNRLAIQNSRFSPLSFNPVASRVVVSLPGESNASRRLLQRAPRRRAL